MTSKPVTLESLLDTRNELVKELKSRMTDKEKRFLLSFKSGKPEWDLLGLNNIDRLPAVQWKLINIKKMPVQKRSIALEKLAKALD